MFNFNDNKYYVVLCLLFFYKLRYLKSIPAKKYIPDKKNIAATKDNLITAIIKSVVILAVLISLLHLSHPRGAYLGMKGEYPS